MSNGNDRSEDNLHVYGKDENGEHLGAYCFGCQFKIPSEAWLRENAPVTLEDLEYELVSTEFNEEVHEGLKSITNPDGKGYRNLKVETTRSAGVRYEFSPETGKPTKVYYPVTKGCQDKPIKESIVGYKVRGLPKTFLPPVGEANNSCDLFMQWKFTTHRGMLLVVGGEEDALAALQMLDAAHKQSGNDKKFDGISVVSGITGEGGVASQIKNQYEFISQFNKVIICMDEDPVGALAEKAIAESLPRGKAFVMSMRNKDPSEYLQKGMEKQFLNDFWGHKAYTPAGIHASTSLYEEALSSAELRGISLPSWFKGLTDFTFGHGIPENEIFVIIAQSSGGKTLFVNSLTNHWVLNEPNHTVGVLSLEATAGRYSRNLLSDHLGVPLNKMSPDERSEYLRRPDVEEKAKQLFIKEDGSPRFYVVDDRGAEIADIKSKAEMMIRKLGCTILICDIWSDLLSNMSVQEQEDLNTWLKRLQKETGITPVLISHIRKGGADEDGVLTEDSIMGSSFLAKASGTTVALERNKQEKCSIKRNTTRVRVLKNREYSETGVCGHVFFDGRDARLYDFEQWSKDNPHMIQDKQP